MHAPLKQAFRAEMRIAAKYYREGNLDESFHHLERAHILGQRYILPHTESHWWMFKVGLRRRDVREIFGQVVRMAASLVISRIWVPVGNTGGANVSPVQPMPVPADLQAILDVR